MIIKRFFLVVLVLDGTNNLFIGKCFVDKVFVLLGIVVIRIKCKVLEWIDEFLLPESTGCDLWITILDGEQ